MRNNSRLLGISGLEFNLGRLDMSNHNEIVYSESEGMDYPAHELQYKNFIKVGTAATAAVATVVALMALSLT